MSAVLLSPHHDDESLFAAFTCAAVQPHVVVVLESHLQEQRGNVGWHGNPITNELRQTETLAACKALHCTVEFWPFRDDDPDWDAIQGRIFRLGTDDPDLSLYVPASHEGGHEHHNALALAAAMSRPTSVKGRYCTYRRGAPDERVTEGREVVPEGWMVLAKLRALACYRSQMHLWPHHFIAEQREYLA